MNEVKKIGSTYLKIPFNKNLMIIRIISKSFLSLEFPNLYYFNYEIRKKLVNK